MNGTAKGFVEALEAALEALKISIDADAVARCRAHFELVIEANRMTNLTRITEPKAAAVRHYADSLALLKWVEASGIEVRTMLDVGTGAGFPAVPLAIARRDWSVTAIDATAKKIRFLESAAEKLGLVNLRCEHAHSRHWKSDETYDLVTTRAVTALPRLLKETSAHVRPSRWLVAYKTASIDRNEEDDAESMVRRMGLQVQEQYNYTLYDGDQSLNRVLYAYRKGV